MIGTRYKDLEEYGLIGNLETCALVGRDGSVDWLCLPFLDSPSVFAAILDPGRGGCFQIEPDMKYNSAQEYERETNILRTTFDTAFGNYTVTDFMPAKRRGEVPFVRALFRRIECTKGYADLTVRLSPRFDYARAAPRIGRAKGGVTAEWREQRLFLQAPVDMRVGQDEATGGLKVRQGDVLWIVLHYGEPRGALDDGECESILGRERRYWRRWAHICRGEECVLAGIWHDVAVRSGLVLKLLSNPDSGAIAAAPTASLPEQAGGVRNWDYRYSWLRDSSLTDEALYHLGHVAESKAYRRWMERIISGGGEPDRIRIMYPLHENVELGEKVLDNLRGYKDSAPVRIGNLASGQVQLDIYGELVNAVYETTRHGEALSGNIWPALVSLVDYVCRIWNTTDSGIWETRGDRQHYVYSKLMCWVALDRGVKIARERGFEADVGRWKDVRDEIRDAILDKGFSKKLGSFVQAFGSEELDATVLLIPQMGLLSYDDPRVLGTVEAVRTHLADENGLICRYLNDDGVAGDEGRFVLCSFWLIRCLALSGRVAEAETLFMRVLRFVSPVGLLSEEIDSSTGKLVGNFPQAFSHIGLVNSALAIGRAKGRKADLAAGRKRKGRAGSPAAASRASS